jgi:DNA-binding response OmpR family regulator
VRKPFDLFELEARIDSVLRRKQGFTEEGVLDTGRLRIDDRFKPVSIDDKEVKLSPKEYLMLQLPASDPGRVFAGAQSVSRVRDVNSQASSGVVKQYVHLLRKKPERHAGFPASVTSSKSCITTSQLHASRTP